MSASYAQGTPVLNRRSRRGDEVKIVERCRYVSQNLAQWRRQCPVIERQREKSDRMNSEGLLAGAR